MLLRQVLIGCVFLVGCVAGGIGSQLVAPPARAGTTPQKWEHYCMRDPDVRQLHDAGLKGWELVTSTPTSGSEFAGLLFCMKRPLP